MDRANEALPVIISSNPTVSIIPEIPAGFKLWLFAHFTWGYVIVYLLILVLSGWILAWAASSLLGFGYPNLRSVGLGLLVIIGLQKLLQENSCNKILFTRDKIIYQKPLSLRLEIPYAEIGRVEINGATETVLKAEELYDLNKRLSEKELAEELKKILHKSFQNNCLHIIDYRGNERVKIPIGGFSTSDTRKILQLLKTQVSSVEFNNDAEAALKRT